MAEHIETYTCRWNWCFMAFKTREERSAHLDAEHFSLEAIERVCRVPKRQLGISSKPGTPSPVLTENRQRNNSINPFALATASSSPTEYAGSPENSPALSARIRSRNLNLLSPSPARASVAPRTLSDISSTRPSLARGASVADLEAERVRIAEVPNSQSAVLSSNEVRNNGMLMREEEEDEAVPQREEEEEEELNNSENPRQEHHSMTSVGWSPSFGREAGEDENELDPNDPYVPASQKSTQDHSLLEKKVSSGFLDLSQSGPSSVRNSGSPPIPGSPSIIKSGQRVPPLLSRQQQSASPNTRKPALQFTPTSISNPRGDMAMSGVSNDTSSQEQINKLGLGYTSDDSEAFSPRAQADAISPDKDGQSSQEQHPAESNVSQLQLLTQAPFTSQSFDHSQ